MKVELYKIIDTIGKEYGIKFEDNNDHFFCEKQDKHKVESWYIRECAYEVYVSYTLEILGKRIDLSCVQSVKAKYHLQEFFNKVNEIKEMAKDYL